MKASIPKIGEGLVTFAENAEFTARGVLGDLFPFIFQASKRMSTRAISRWLEESHGVKLSAVSISRALRTPGKYWIEFADEIAPAARDIEDVTGVSMDEFLLRSEVWEELIQMERNALNFDASNSDELWEAESAHSRNIGFLQEKWFVLDRLVRGECVGYVTNRAHELKGGEHEQGNE